MSRIPKILYQGQPGTVDTALYTTPIGKKSHITSILCGNTDTTTKWITINIVPNGGTTSNANILGGKQKKLVGTGDTSGGGEWLYEVTTPLAAGDKIGGIQELATAISVTIIGLEEDV